MKTTSKKHYRIKNKFRFITFVTLLSLVLSIGFASISGLADVSGSEVKEYITVQVAEGDTLWDLAQKYGPSNVDCRKLVYEIGKLNNVDASSLQVGQYISIPVNN